MSSASSAVVLYAKKIFLLNYHTLSVHCQVQYVQTSGTRSYT